MDETKIHEELALSIELLDSYKKEISCEPTTSIAINACWKTDPIDMCVKRNRLYESIHVFSHKVEMEGKPTTNQKSSGRCWIYAGLNVMRIPFMKSLNLDDFEFSQTYLFFWDKIERCNFFLNNMVECLRKGEEIDGRLMSYLLSDPTNDGGQWDMFVNLIKKHGLIPKKCFPESYSADNSYRINRLLTTKLREYTRDLKKVISAEPSDDVVDLLKEQMKEIFRIVSICLGIPPSVFTWEYYDKQKNYKSIGPVTPLEFYEKHVKRLYNVEEKICLVNDPRPGNPFGCTYTVYMLGNMVNGRGVVYNNQHIDVLLKLAAESIKGGESVWFGCEIGKRYATKLGLQDIDVHDFKGVFGVEINMGMSKSERLMFGDSAMTHAMNLTAVTLNEAGETVKWRVENSWGEDRGEKGYQIMTTDWFREFVFEIVVDKKYVPEDILKVFDQPPSVLPAWDPMGTLAL